ncbi:MAG: vitamin B12-dependent ribonucleotide reductase [Minisyncoccales bacterium]
MSKKVTQIRKRDGRIVKLDKEKIATAILKAAKSVGGENKELAQKLAYKVTEHIDSKFAGRKIPCVEDVQDAVEKILIENGHAKTAKAYILYRHERNEIREQKELIGVEDDVKMSLNAIKVLEKRYLLKDDNGKVIETPKGLFKRVANNIAHADKKYNDFDPKKSEKEFFEMMTNLDFLPNSPTLMNAGKSLQQLAACFVLPIDDSMEAIFESVKNTALIHQSGGGTGFSFSRLRPKNDMVLSTKGQASGPLSFMNVFDAATETVKQGGTRRGANMAILRIDHPDILDFIVAKEKNNVLNNFNISVAMTEKFMEAVLNEENYDLINPRTKEPIKSLNAKRVFDLMVTMAWKNGEPGIIFVDRINKFNPTPHIGEIESTNPCGEQPLLPYESCNLGSINLSNHIKDNNVDWEKLKQTTHKAIHFLDNVIDMGKYPIKKIKDMVHANRKIGLGVMGWADMLIKLGIAYNSKEGVKKAEEVMEFIAKESKHASINLAKTRGEFPNFKGSIFDKNNEQKIRNATTTTIAPTGTLSILGDCSSGIEPLFAISFIRNIMDNTEMLEVNPVFKEMIKKEGLYSDALMRSIAKKGTIQNIENIPQKLKDVFVTSHDIKPEWHVKMQAAFQKYVDNAVSKTVNFPYFATTTDVEEVFILAYKLGCKGITIYRDGSRDNQVLNIEKVNKEHTQTSENKNTKKKKQSKAIETKGDKVVVSSTYSGGCTTCDV